MTGSAAIQASLYGSNALPLRPVGQVMQLERLGAMHQSRLSFMRALVRRIMRERWQITPALMELDDQGYGRVIYRIQAPQGCYSFVLFSDYLSPAERNDRVIATKWDLTMALVAGDLAAEVAAGDESYLQKLRDNVPKQEAGRVDSRVFVLSRANRSARNFDYVVDQLANGEQPDAAKIAKVGYLYRTTAVYGSGKLGMADWQKVQSHWQDFARPFSAEMFVCFMLRNFSLMQAEHIAKIRHPETYKPMELGLKRYFGIGNSTGLGMAPYLINHPLLINRWVEMRELALARICAMSEPDSSVRDRFGALLQRCDQHTREVFCEDEWQQDNNQLLLTDLQRLQEQMLDGISDWGSLLEWSNQNCSLQGQELLVSVLLELYPTLVDELEDHCCQNEVMDLNPQMPLTTLKSLIENHYDWALDIDFSNPEASQTFWYRSEDKMEPRLGDCSLESGIDKQMPLGIGHLVRQCYDQLQEFAGDEQATCAQFLLQQPQSRGIVRRIQAMSNSLFGEIRANLLDKDVLPMHLLRAKLAFFGVSKFDPRSKLWVRNTMFQGAPLLEDIGKPFADDWFMPLNPQTHTPPNR